MKTEVDYKSLVSNLRDGVLSINEASHIVYANESAYKLFNYSPPELIGMDLTLLMPQNFRPMHKAGMKRFLETGEAKVIGRVVELQGLKKGGETFHIELSISQALKSEEGYLFTALIRDINDRKKIEADLLQSNKDLKEKIEEMEKMYRIMMGREKKVLELKEEIEKLKQQLKK